MSLTSPQRMRRVTVKQMLKHYGDISKPTLWRHIRQGLIPQPRYLKPKRPFWLMGDLEDHDKKLLEDGVIAEPIPADERTANKEVTPKGSVVSNLRKRLGL